MKHGWASLAPFNQSTECAYMLENGTGVVSLWWILGAQLLTAI